MCGIAGGFWKKDENVRESLNRALERIALRGPNGRGMEFAEFPQGQVALGHNRLSIIDLSEGGHQPMLSKDRRYGLIFNGEIYNYRELREELKGLGCVFFSDSDTEVLLNAWAKWKDSCLTRLEGMFAFVVLDSVDQKLTCVRDGFGIKPFFYSHENDRFVFASECQAVQELRAEKPRANFQKGYDYLVHGVYDNDENSFIEGILHLLPGHKIEVDLKSGQVKPPQRWWAPSAENYSDLPYNQAKEILRAKFLENVKLHLRSDVPLGAALSGGIDSSAVVCAVREVSPEAEIQTFSYIAKGTPVDEERWVDLVVQKAAAKSFKIEISKEELASDLDHIIQCQGEPFGSSSIYAQYRVFQKARDEKVIVVLEGQGADELLAGYMGYPGFRILSLLERGQVWKAHLFAKNWGRYPGRSYFLAWQYLAQLVLPDFAYNLAKKYLVRESVPSWLRADILKKSQVRLEQDRVKLSPENKGRRVTEQLAKSLQNRGLPALLRHGDRNSMNFSIEGRVPFLTTSFAEFLLSLPEEYLISDLGETKSIFRDAMRGIVPDAILDRKDKVGFETPEKKWFIELAPQVRNWLADADNIPFLNSAELVRHFDDIIEGKKPFSWQVWRWVNYVRWYHFTFVKGA